MITELNVMVDDIKPHIIGITESWANSDITDWLTDRRQRVVVDGECF